MDRECSEWKKAILEMLDLANAKELELAYIFLKNLIK